MGSLGSRLCHASVRPVDLSFSSLVAVSEPGCAESIKCRQGVGTGGLSIQTHELF